MNYLSFAWLFAVAVMSSSAGANAQVVDWVKIENACSQQASEFDAALVGYSFSAESGNIKVNSARTNLMSVRVFLSQESRVWSGGKSREIADGIQEMRRLVENINDRGPGGLQYAKADRAFWLHRICLNEVFLSEMNRIQDSRKNTQTPSSPGTSTQSQSTQEFAEQAINLAQQNQAKAEAQRKKDGRRRNYPELDASSCLTPEVRPGFTGFKNSCPYPVRYTYCALNPKIGTGAAFVDCNKQSGAGSVPSNGEDFAHMKGAEGVSLVACKLPATAISRKFENGQLWADCVKLGGN